MRALFSRLAGRQLEIDEAVLRSERDTGHRNRANAWLMLNSGMIMADPDRVLDLYFRQCSVLVHCADLALMACTLETLGCQPLTGAQVFAAGVTWDVLSVKTTCGIYDYAGQWLYAVGLSTKSGVSGMIMAGAAGPSVKYSRPSLGQRRGRLPRLPNRPNPGDRRRVPARLCGLPWHSRTQPFRPAACRERADRDRRMRVGFQGAILHAARGARCWPRR